MDKYCPYCGSPYKENTKFCPRCGKELTGTDQLQYSKKTKSGSERMAELKKRFKPRLIVIIVALVLIALVQIAGLITERNRNTLIIGNDLLMVEEKAADQFQENIMLKCFGCKIEI